jgi:hypothetical protein
METETSEAANLGSDRRTRSTISVNRFASGATVAPGRAVVPARLVKLNSVKHCWPNCIAREGKQASAWHAQGQTTAAVRMPPGRTTRLISATTRRIWDELQHEHGEGAIKEIIPKRQGMRIGRSNVKRESVMRRGRPARWRLSSSGRFVDTALRQPFYDH